MRKIFIGADPGFSGAIVAIDLNTPTKINQLLDMPTVQDGVNTDRLRICGKKLARFLSNLEDKPKFAVVEKVHASPQMGVTSAFRFGEGYGTLIGVLESLNIKIYHAVPAVWKSHFDLTRDKKKSINLARKLYPADLNHFSLAKHDGRAEAALLARYGFEKFGGSLKPVESLQDLF